MLYICAMEIEMKIVKLTKSKIMQMDFIMIPSNHNFDVLGWVNINQKKWVIIKFIGSYYRTDLLKEVLKEEKSTQFSLETGGYEFPFLTVVKYYSYNNNTITFSPERDDNKNIKLYDDLVSYKRKVDIAGQIFY